MAKKKTKNQPKKKQVNAENVIGLHSEVTDQPITQTLEVNYMPYAMSVNVSRAFPEIDGFKPSHRKLLYTMYKMGLLKGERQKSANIVGQTMKLNPHGDAAIYETMVRLATGNEALLAPFVESKGNFGKYYSGDLSYAASRYTEAKLSPISAEIFKDIDKGPCSMCNTPSSMRATLLRTTPSSSSTLRYQSCASSGMGMYARSLLPAMRQPKLSWAKALSSAAASCVATKKYSLYMGLVWSDQAPSRLNQNSFCITKASCIRLCGIMQRTFSQVSRSFPWGV